MANVTITGTDGGDISEAYGSSGGTSNRNNGAAVNSIAGWIASVERCGFWKVATSAIPAGNITVVQHQTQLNGTDPSLASVNIVARRLLVDWGEGDNINTVADAGEVTWDSAKHGSVTWTTGGAKSSGNDYAAGEEEGPFATATSWSAGDASTWVMNGGDAYNWFEGWKSGALSNYGWVVVTTSANPAPSNGYWNPRTSENPLSQSSVYLEYSAATVSFYPGFALPVLTRKIL